MIGRIESRLRRAGRWLSRAEWTVRLLRLPRAAVPAGPGPAPGLVMVQIDGLSHTQLCRALAAGRMPFLNSLMQREHYRLHLHYSGLPSSTPAVQGELFYGIRRAVPAFGFRWGETGEAVRMVEAAAVAGIERKLAEQGGEPLLKDGSAWADVYTGGAAEAHFCPAAIGWGTVLRPINPFALGLLALANLLSFVRTAGLLAIELVLAVIDCIRGLIAGRDLVKELVFVPSRVAICILLRELITIGARVDIARGLPVIHLNFLGYDEQAHRRGPSSAFAHWSLRGIDDAIARIWRAAKSAGTRDYDVWVYADHGQEDTAPYRRLHGRTLTEAVDEVFEKLAIAGPVAASASASADSTGSPPASSGDEPGNAAGPAARRGGESGMQHARARLLLGNRAPAPRPPALPARGKPGVVAIGPVGLVYLPRPPAPAETDRIARALVSIAHAPLVLALDGPGRCLAWTADGAFVLPRDRADILGADHPFLDEAAHDLIELCRHPDAGDLVICGWRKGHQPVSFPVENGSHAGPGPEETRGFALLPSDAPLPPPSRPYLRPSDLRAAALCRLGRAAPAEGRGAAGPVPRRPIDSAGAAAGGGARTLRIMTYNVHSCIGMDGQIAPERIARVIARHAPDIVCLQELDAGRPRTAGVDQAAVIARHLEMEFHFHPAIHLEEERYGDAVLTHLPMRLVRAAGLPGARGLPLQEPRGALWVAVAAGDVELQVINTHLGLWPRERQVQAAALLGPDWLGHPDCRPPVVLCGDLNAVPNSPPWRRLADRLDDAQTRLAQRPRKTWYGRFPTARIDHIFVDRAIEVLSVTVPAGALERVASDHLPLIAEIRVGGKPAALRGAGGAAAVAAGTP